MSFVFPGHWIWQLSELWKPGNRVNIHAKATLTLFPRTSNTYWEISASPPAALNVVGELNWIVVDLLEEFDRTMTVIWGELGDLAHWRWGLSPFPYPCRCDPRREVKVNKECSNMLHFSKGFRRLCLIMVCTCLLAMDIVNNEVGDETCLWFNKG